LLRCTRNDGDGTVPNPGYLTTALALPSLQKLEV
jgi:hypothetical protein